MTRPVRRRTQAATTAGKDYAAIAAKKITSPSKLAAENGQMRPPRILVYARNKKGKTRFSMSAGKGKILIVDPERGTDRFVKSDPSVWHFEAWEEMEDIYQFLRSGKHDYSWVALDGLTKISTMALRYITRNAEEADLTRRPGLVKLQDRGNAGELVKTMLDKFHTLDMGIIYTAQERQVEANFDDEEDEEFEGGSVQYVPDLPKGIRAAVNGIVDVVGRLYTVKVPGEEGSDVVKRRLWLAPSVSYDTGARSEYKLPDYLESPTVPKLVGLMEGKKVSGNSN